MSEFDISNIRRLDGGLLLVFRELLRCRNATEASRRLHSSQSTVSHALTRLRDLFDDPLFIRRPHGLEPTRRALALGPRIEALVDLAAETLGDADGFNPRDSERRFSLGAPEFLTALIGAPLVEALRKNAPNTSVDVWFLGQDQALDSLRRGEIDLALGRFGNLGRTGPRTGISIETLYVDRYCVVARKGHPTLKGSIDLATFTKVGHVFASSPSEGAPGETLPSPRVVATAAVVPHWLTALTVVSRTDLITTCPRRLAERQADVLNLEVMEAPYPNEPFTVSAVRRTDRQDGGVDWFLEQVRRCAR